MTTGMIGRKVGMMTLYDGGGIARGVTVVELGPNPVTQIRTQDRDGYQAIQIGFDGQRKRLTRPERGHLQAAGVADRPLSKLREFRVDSAEEYTLGQTITVEQFEPGSYVDVTGTSKGRGFAGVVRRWNFRGGPKTHGQSDRWRAPGSIGAGTTPGRVWKGQKMGGHMGNVTATVRNLLVVAVDASRHLIFVEGSVPGPRNGFVSVEPGVRAALADFAPAEVAPAVVTPVEVSAAVEEPEDPALEEETAVEVATDTPVTDDDETTPTDAAPSEETETDEAETDDETPTDVAPSEATETDEAETDDETPTDAAPSEATETDEAETDDGADASAEDAETSDADEDEERDE